MPERQRQRGLTLPEDPSEEELARNWTLSEADRAEVQRCRGDDNRRRFALQLCVLRQYGRFLDRYQDVPVRILNYLNRQLGLMPTVSLPERMTIGLTCRRTARRIKRLKEIVLTISQDYSDRPTPDFLALSSMATA
jgi:hypothetical protein